MKRIFVLFGAVFLVMALAGAAGADESAVPGVGDPVPDFTLPDYVSGKDVNYNNDIKDKAAISALVFMNTGCSACLAEMREISKVVGVLGEDKVRGYAVAVDARGEAVVKTYHELYKFNLSYLLDPTFSIPPMFGFSYTPALVLADNTGKVLHIKGGYNPAKDAGTVAQKIKELVAK